MAALPEIQHTFQPEAPVAHPVLSAIFGVLALVAAPLTFLYLLGTLKINIKNFGTSPADIGFVACLLLNVAVLIMFYSFLNIVQTGALIIALSVPTFIFANKSFSNQRIIRTARKD